MKIIVGLGNPGKEYALNRHNVGFMAVDKYAYDNGLSWSEKSKLSCYIAEGEGFVLIKPTTFMNDSGRAVASVGNFYKSDEILVICDDIDREYGSIRKRAGGGHGGNNGLESIISAIGEDFARIRIGVQNQHRTRENAAQFVLSDFSTEEKVDLAAILDGATSAINDFIIDDSKEETKQII